MKKIISIAALTISMMLLASCSGGGEPAPTPVPTADPELVKNTISATIELEGGDEIELELYPDLAPKTVENFVELAEDGFYDGTIFHRVIEDFMIQGGGYDENLKQKKASSIEGEFSANGFENTLPHVRGTVSMARAQDMDSATSQFFIVQQDSTFGQYAAFGSVTEGMDVVDEIAEGRTGSVDSSGMDDVPVDEVVIKTIRINSSSSSKKTSSNDKDDDKNDDSDADADDSDKNSSRSASPSAKPSASPNTKSSSSSGKTSSSDDELTAEDIERILNESQSL